MSDNETSIRAGLSAVTTTTVSTNAASRMVVRPPRV